VTVIDVLTYGSVEAVVLPSSLPVASLARSCGPRVGSRLGAHRRSGLERQFVRAVRRELQ